jgi:hypothetical protein
MNTSQEGGGVQSECESKPCPDATTLVRSSFPTGSETCTSGSGFWKNGGQRGAGVRGRALGMWEECTSLCSSGASCTPRQVGKRGQPLQ